MSITSVSANCSASDGPTRCTLQKCSGERRATSSSISTPATLRSPIRERVDPSSFPSNHHHPALTRRQTRAEDGGGRAGGGFVGAQVQDQALVFLQVHLVFQAGLHADAVDLLQHAEEDGVLPVLAVAVHDFED